MAKKYNIMILSGGFDPVHFAHVKMFKAAKEQADVVIVGLNSDAWLERKKGKAFMPWNERAQILDAMRYIDRVWPMNDDDGTACDVIQRVFNFTGLISQQFEQGCKIAFGNGGDRSGKDKVPTAENVLCEKLGIEMVWGLGGSEKEQSSSWLLKNAQEPK